jgi:hypothetical protein
MTVMNRGSSIVQGRRKQTVVTATAAAYRDNFISLGRLMSGARPKTSFANEQKMLKEVVNRWTCTRCTRALENRRSSTRNARAYSSVTSSKNGRPFRMAVIGSGPAGFYTSYKVMSKIENSVVDMYEHLPIPFGLVRFGVAPDHPEVKVGNI